MPATRTDIDWGGPYSCAWRVMRVDPATWADAGEISGVTGADVKLDASGRLLLSGGVDVQAGATDDFAETWARIEVLADQGGIVERHAVATMLLGPSKVDVRRGRSEHPLEGRSPLQPAEDERLLAGTTAPMGADGAAWAASMLACCPAPVSYATTFQIAEHHVFDAGTTRLEAVREVLDAAGWCVQLAGDGTISLAPLPTEPALALGARMLGTRVRADDSTFDVPNRVTVRDGERTYTASDDNPDSPTSHATRGRWVDLWESGTTDMRAGESAQQYAERLLSEAMSVAGTREYERAWVPGITTSDVVRATLTEARMDHDMRITRQTIRMGAGVTVDETCEVM